jgi:hypothetical protein
MANSKSGSFGRAPVPCNECGRFYRADLIKQCPGCAAVSDPLHLGTAYPTARNVSSGATLDDLVRAQNRTTHAVRAFVRFLFIQLTGLTIVYFLWNLFVESDGNPFIAFLVLAVWLGTVIWSSVAGWDELRKSNVQ